MLKVAPEQVVAVPTSAFSLPAKRPQNSRMDTSKLRDTFEFKFASVGNGRGAHANGNF